MNEKPGDLRDRIEELEREQHAWKMLDEEREAEIARLREREAQNDDVHQGWINRTNRAEARVAQLEREVNRLTDGIAADLACVARLEEALRGVIDFGDRASVQIARLALAHEEEA